MKGEDLIKMEENLDQSLSENDNQNNSNQGDGKDESGNNVSNNKKPRGSRYRGVSRNGNQWQVKNYFNN